MLHNPTNTWKNVNTSGVALLEVISQLDSPKQTWVEEALAPQLSQKPKERL